MPNYPKTLERDYRRALRRRVQNVERATRYAFDRWLEWGARSEINERARTDSAGSDVEQAKSIIRRVRTAYDATYSTAKDLDLASKTFERVDGYTYRGIKREYTAAVGVEPVLNAQTRAVAEAFIKENVALIQDLTTKQLAQIEADVVQAIESGQRAEAISKAIRERSGMARRRADLIARDQMGKAVSQLNQKRMQSLGVDKYIWRTVGDERVRDEHAARDGETFSWSDPPEDGHPGEPINCRCSAEPVLTDILDELGVDYDPADFNQPGPAKAIKSAPLGGRSSTKKPTGPAPIVGEGKTWTREHPGYALAGVPPRPLSEGKRISPGLTHFAMASQRPINPIKVSLPIEKLSMRGAEITSDGIGEIERHLARFGSDAENEKMISRLKRIEAGDLPITDYDVRFYTHELREFERYKAAGWEHGQPSDSYEFWDAQHTATLEDYGVNELTHPLYHPEASDAD